MSFSSISAAKRNYGIDLLRVLSMFYIVVLHCLHQGGVFSVVSPGSLQYQTAQFLNAACLCAVNIFGLISGYVGYTDQPKRFSLTGYLMLWLEVVFYGAAAAVIFQLIDSDLVNLRDFFRMCLPVTNGLYWYFTAYTGLYFLIPLLNAGVRNCSNHYLSGLLLAAFFLFSAFGSCTDAFYLQKGYSFVWLVLLYIIGAILKKTGLPRRISKKAAFFGVLIFTLLSWFLSTNWFEYHFLSLSVDTTALESYVFPTYVLTAIAYTILFSKLVFPAMLHKWIAFLGSGSFAVYLLNNQQFIWDHVILNHFLYLEDPSVFTLLSSVLGFSLAFALASIVVDFLRRELFRALKLRPLISQCDRLAIFITDRLLPEGENTEA